MNFSKNHLSKKLSITSVAQKILERCFTLLEDEEIDNLTRDNIITSLSKLLNIQKNLLEQEKEIRTLIESHKNSSSNFTEITKDELDILKRYIDRLDEKVIE